MNIFPQPKSLTEQAGAFCFGSRVVMHVNCNLSERRKTLLRSLWNRFSLTGSTLEIAENSLLPAFCARIGQAELPALEAADEYAAVVTPAGIGLAAKDESDEIAIANMRRILDALPGVTFGMYECPHPYRRPLTARMLEAMAETGRFSFIKDTCCDAALIAHRLKVLDGRIQLFNANAATILDSLRDGADGFSGIMANYHPDLYVWLGEHFREQPEKARKLAAALSVMSAAESHCHPVDAKYHMDRVGVPMRLHVRNQDESKFGPLDRRFVDDLIILEDAVRQRLAEK